MTTRAREIGPFLLFFGALVVIQGVHMFEHVVQLAQVSVFGVAEDDALGLLGYVLAIQGTEEWLHLAFNGSYLLGLIALVVPLWRRVPALLPLSGFVIFAAGVALETWHGGEHAVIIANVIANDGCPCPGILDSRTGISDTYLHFGYNAAVYAAVLVAFHYVVSSRGRASDQELSLPVASATAETSAEVLFGPITGNGHIRDLDFGGRPIFVMPGPYAPGSHVERRLAELGELADRQHSE
jgi:hypothetical protein